MHNSGMIYGYARVSTAAQDETGQARQLKAAGCEKVFCEKITGTTADRPQLQKLMKALAPGDVVITPAVDRLSRDTTDLPVIARDMQRARGRYPVTGRSIPRYHVRLRRDHLCDPRGGGEARTPPHSRAQRARPGRRQKRTLAKCAAFVADVTACVADKSLGFALRGNHVSSLGVTECLRAERHAFVRRRQEVRNPCRTSRPKDSAL
jgi:Resolvase, N terminal domain